MARIGENTGVVLSAQEGLAPVHSELGAFCLEVDESEIEFLKVVTFQFYQQTIDGGVEFVPQLETVALELKCHSAVVVLVFIYSAIGNDRAIVVA